jgi:hypothetical protein
VKKLSVALVVFSALAVACGDKSPTEPTSPTRQLVGFVRDSETNLPLQNARVELIDTTTGLFTGNFVLTDTSGRYTFPGLTGSQSFRASKDGYEGHGQRVHLALTLTLDFALIPLSSLPPRDTILLGETRTGTIGPGDPMCNGMFFRRPCKRFILIVNQGATLYAKLTWQGADDIDLELWVNDKLFDKSLTCQACGVGTSLEEFARFVPAGEYELRATLFEGLGSSFTLSVTRID